MSNKKLQTHAQWVDTGTNTKVGEFFSKVKSSIDGTIKLEDGQFTFTDSKGKVLVDLFTDQIEKFTFSRYYGVQFFVIVPIKKTDKNLRFLTSKMKSSSKSDNRNLNDWNKAFKATGVKTSKLLDVPVVIWILSAIVIILLLWQYTTR